MPPTSEPLDYRLSEIDRLRTSDLYAIKIDVRDDSMNPSATRWMNITADELAAIRELLREDQAPKPAPAPVRYVNVGAHFGLTRPTTAQELRDALADNPGGVMFDATAAVGPDKGRVFVGDDLLPGGVTLTVCGPDPYTKREWWLQVTRGENGAAVVADVVADHLSKYLD